MPPGLSSMMTVKRIHKELADLSKEDLGPMTLTPSDNLYTWYGTIPGPQGSVYEGGVFELEITLPTDYPFSAPKVIFKTRIYHMNISESGNVCIDILKQNWSPALSVFKVMLSLSSLLTDPNPKDPLVPSIATQFMRNRRQHDSTARHWTEMYARPKPPPPTPPPATSPTPNRKGKGRATNTRTPTNPTSSRRPRVVDPEPIIIDDSDEEGRRRISGKRKRDPQVIDLVDELEEGHSKRRGVEPHARSSHAANGSARPLVQLGDVIVIDDD